MKSHTRHLVMRVPGRMGFVNITAQERRPRGAVPRQRDAHHRQRLHQRRRARPPRDYARWLEQLAPHEPTERYRHNLTGEDNGDAHLKRQVMGREVVVAVTEGSSTSAPGSRSSTASSTAAAEARAGEDHRGVALVTQKNASTDDPGYDDLYEAGTVAQIMKTIDRGGQGLQLVVRSLRRFRITKLSQTEPYLRAEIEERPEDAGDPVVLEALLRNVKETTKKLAEAMPKSPEQRQDWVEIVARVEHPGNVADLLAAALDMPIEKKIELLDTPSVRTRLEKLLEVLHERHELAELSRKIDSQVRARWGRASASTTCASS
jgi:Lon protease-like protein